MNQQKLYIIKAEINNINQIDIETTNEIHESNIDKTLKEYIRNDEKELLSSFLFYIKQQLNETHICIDIDINNSGTYKKHFYKFGISGIPSERKATLQTGNAFKLVEIQSFECYNARLLERTIHKHLEDKHILGEWFGLTDEELCDAIYKIEESIELINAASKQPKFSQKSIKNNYNCIYCQYTTTVKSNLNRHIKTDSDMYNKKQFDFLNSGKHKCSYCNRIFQKLSSLSRHETSCGKKSLERAQTLKGIAILEKEIKELISN